MVKIMSEQKDKVGENLNDLKEYVDRKMTLAKLDSALLYFSSSLSLIFGVGYALAGLKWVQFFLPLLIPGWVMPVYTGYIRGALIQDSLEERFRGWIYMITGAGIYVASLLSSTTLEFLLPNIQSPYLLVIITFTLPIVIFAPLLFTVFYIPFRVLLRIFKLLKKGFGDELIEVFVFTALGALCLALSLSTGIVTFIFPERFPTQFPAVLFLRGISIIIFVLFLLCEREAREFIGNSEKMQVG